ncbi:MAG: hypothetical protein V2I67_19975 [Thermoanaerobaculales bacterium]|nr:hypothetical protein [Thermoanaerobaculales bacterium]
MNFRRIVQRGLVNYSGELWYREGLPSDVFRRLVVRKENETPLDRFSGDYEELMTYADFRDLADIIVGNDALKDRLTILEPRDGTSLLERLHELEDMRRNVVKSGSESVEETERLSRYFDEFRTAIKRGRKTAQPSPESKPPSAPPEVQPVKPPTPDHGDETLESIFDSAEEPSPPPSKPRPGRLVVKVSSGGLRDAGKKTEEPVEAELPQADVPSPAGGVGAMNTPVTHVSTRQNPGGVPDLGPVEEAEGLERALRGEDHAAILKALHVEVTEIADGMLRRDPKQGHVAWEHVNRRGWFETHREDFGLDPLIEFYELADGFLEAFSSGAKSSDLKAILAQAGFSKLLLGLREMFLASRAKA